jgi:glycosyltransferase involved in cell wall biosynthesis
VKPIRILVDSFADAALPNAQMGNAREIVSRLNPEAFHVSMFTLGLADQRIAGRRNTRLIQLPRRKQTVRILAEFVWGSHELLFYMKAAPASRMYCNLRQRWRDSRITVATVESQSDFKNETTITPEGIRLWEQTVLRCDYLFSNSGNVQKSLQHQYGFRSDVIPTGVDTEFFTPDWERPRNRRIQVLFVGSLRAFKQPDFLLSAASAFPEADFRIAGNGPMAPGLASRVEREQLHNVNLLGPLDAGNLRSEYRTADIFLFPSKWEGSPKVILEAAASGLPVIIRNSYSPETVIDGVTGFQSASDADLLSGLRMLLRNEELRRSFGSEGRRHSKAFDWALITRQWETAFIEIARSRTERYAS